MATAHQRKFGSCSRSCKKGYGGKGGKSSRQACMRSCLGGRKRRKR